MRQLKRLMNEGSVFGKPFGGAKPSRRHRRNFWQALSPQVNPFNQGQPWHPDNQDGQFIDEVDEDFDYPMPD